MDDRITSQWSCDTRGVTVMAGFVPFMLVAMGGALGAMLRYASGLALARYAGGFPLATFTVNGVGALAIGVLMAVLADDALKSGWRLFLMVGLLGGFTTFSAFAADMVELLARRQFGFFIAYAFGSLGLGLVAFCVGYGLGQWVLRSGA